MSVLGNPIVVGGGGATASIVVSPASGKTITNCTVTNPRGTVISGTQVGSVWTYDGLNIFGTYHIVATDGTNTQTSDQLVDMVGVYPVTINYSRLPVGYTEVEYIESTGTQYIDTNFTPTSASKMHLNFAVTDTTKTGLFGTRNGGGLTTQITIYQSKIWMQFCTGDVITNLTGFSFTVGQFDDYVIQNGSQVANGTTYGTQTSSSSTPTKYILFGRSDGGSMYFGSVRLKVCELYSNSSTLARNFVPCINPSNVVGMYDLVSNTFFDNNGTGVFIAGNPV